MNLSVIPEALHKDDVFKRHICPITRKPIRDPVGDPNGYTLYERSAIVKWLKDNQYRAPITQNPLSPEQLVPKAIQKKLIDDRMRFYQTNLTIYLNANPAVILPEQWE